jgi:predicted TPR repeat methyltransferase
MHHLQFSSGDLVADRRAAYADMLADEGDWAAAAELMRDCLSLAPAWAAGWYSLGEMCAEAGDAPGASEAWRECLRLDAADRCGAALRLELAGEAHGLGSAPSGFVEALFDQYAQRFDHELVRALGYRVPELLDAAIARSGTAEFAHAFDLGCGTGLMGERLRRRASLLTGQDISAGMLSKARAKGIYDRLEQSDLQQVSGEGVSVDLVTAADVLIYLGDLDRLFLAVSRMLVPAGVFAFSVELDPGSHGYVLRDSRRYAHSRDYVCELLDRHGFQLLDCARETLRFDRGSPVEGLIVTARRRAASLEAALPVELDEPSDPATAIH